MNPSPKLTDQEKRNIATSFGSSSQYQRIENITNRVLNHLLKRWKEKKSIAQPSKCALISDKIAALKIYLI